MGLGCAGKPRAHTSNATAWLWLGSSQIARPALQSHRLTQVTGSGLVSSRRWSAGAGVAPARQPGRRAVMATCSWTDIRIRCDEEAGGAAHRDVEMGRDARTYVSSGAESMDVVRSRRSR
jgi:hypothetical protein